VCGQLYQVNRPRGSVKLDCPKCGHLIVVNEADFQTDYREDGSIRFHDEATQTTRLLAGDGDERIRMSGEQLVDEADITEQQSQRQEDLELSKIYRDQLSVGGSRIATGFADDPSHKPPERSFAKDLLASFWFAGNMNNLYNILLTAVPWALLELMFVALWPSIFIVLILIPLIVVFAYIIQFYWLVLKVTASGEDEIPWFDTEFSLWYNVALPMFRLLFASILCSVPCLIAMRVMAPSLAASLIQGGLLAVGWFFWPITVTSVAIGETVLFARPDWLVRCTFAIGPIYMLAWLLSMLTLALWWSYSYLLEFIGLIPSDALRTLVSVIAMPLSAVVNIYFGYVLFRLLGLLYRHRRVRLERIWFHSEETEFFGHCPKCNYNLTGNVSGVCPECGEKINVVHG
jgi:hypothetical protein